MPRTMKVKVYTYDELSEAAQENAISWWASVEDHSTLCITEDFTGTLRALGYPMDDVCWRLGHCQGDGMAFYGKITNPSEFMSKRLEYDGYHELVLQDDKERANIGRLQALADRCLDRGYGITYDISRNSYGYHYSHQNTMSVSCYFEGHACEHIYKPFMEFAEWVRYDIKKISGVLEESGYSVIDDMSYGECAIETLRANEYLFTEDGMRFAYA